jgi:DNA repair exonuclease SbcCD ATPase subunit
MKITLKNFRCHVDRVFEIPETGLVNLSGASGDGKSTILSSIVYGLYGKIPGKYKKPYARGKKSCTVEIEYLGLEITRTKPNRVLVVYDGTTTEDDAAQSVIVDVIGMSYEEFMVGAYIVQRSNASILSMTPLEQVRFVEVLAATSAEHIKEAIKAKKEEFRDLSLKTQGEIDALVSTLEGLQSEVPEEPPPIPDEILAGFAPVEARKKIKRLEVKVGVASTAIQKIQIDISKARKEGQRLEDIRKKIDVLNTKREMCMTVIENSNIALGKRKSVEELQEDINIYEKAIRQLKKREELQKRRRDLDEAIKEHKTSTRKAIKKLEGQVLDLEAIEALEKKIGDVSKLEAEYSAAQTVYTEHMKAKEKAKKELKAIFRDMKANKMFAGSVPTQPLKAIDYLKKIRANILRFECPSCQAKVCLDGGILCLAGDETDSTAVTYDAESVSMIDGYIETIGRLSEMLKDVSPPIPPEGDSSSTIQKEYMKSKRVRDEYEALNKGTLPPVLEKMESAIKKEEILLSKTPPTDAETKGMVYTENKLSSLKQQMAEVERISLEISDRNKELERYNVEVAKLTAMLPKGVLPDITKDLEHSLSKITKEVIDLNLQISSERSKLDNVSEYENYMASKEAVAVAKRKVGVTQRSLKDTNALLEGLVGLEATCKEAEILALEETVNSINEHAKVYLDYFFEDPIIVELRCVKEVKSRKTLKLQMNTSIEHKGGTYDDIEELSGGERQRCDMAFLLAVSDILGGKILMLDECLNNLDASINTEVLGLVRDLANGSEKLVLVISHEAVKGLFDSEVVVAEK